MGTILVLKIVSAIVELRLLPYIGFFITTVLKMIPVMLKLIVLYAFIGGGFALVFVALQRDPNCKAKRVEGFENLGTSIYTVYNLMIGMGDAAGTDRLDVLVVYIIYSILTIVMLLNLIIAIMTAVSDSISNESCKTAMMKADKLEDTLSAEATFCLGPWSGCMIRWLGKLGGFHYEKLDLDSSCCFPRYDVQIELEYD